MTKNIYSSILETLAKALEGIPFPSATFIVEDAALRLLAASNLQKNTDQDELPMSIDIKPGQLQEKFLAMPESLFWLNGDEKIFDVSSDSKAIPELFDFASRANLEKVSFFQASSEKGFHGLIMVGCYADHPLTSKNVQDCANLIKLACAVFEQATLVEKAKDSIADAEALNAITSAMNTPWNTTAFFATIHEQIKKSIGDFTFTGVLYDEKTETIRTPYTCEEGVVQTIGTCPVGDSLTSIPLRTREALLLNENMQNQADALGVKLIGKPAKSWMGAPLVIENQAIGALIVQDLEKENVFTRDHFERLSTLANQVAGILFNARMLDESRNKIAKAQIASEIARDISSALDLDELLLKAVSLIRDRFAFYYAAIFLVDNTGNNVVIREATGEAGTLMKRIGHKLAIGSKSVVGFVASQGEPLLVNDTAKDATYLPNELLPNTRAEAAIPLKVGDRILGVLDVQSEAPFSFSPDDLTILRTLADQVAIAVNNTELFAEIQEHLSQHRLLHHITTSAASGTTLDEALASAVEGLQVTLGGDRVAILLVDAERNNLVTKAWVGYSEEATGLTIPFGAGITGWVAAHRKPLRVDDVTQDARYIQASANTRSELALPLIFRNDILGVLNVESELVSAYTENDEEMLGTLAGSLAAIIANTRLVDQIRAQAERERLLYEITSKIRRSTDMQTILSTTVDEIRRATGAHKTQITLGIKKGDVDQISGKTARKKG